jgi:hypothetical protein
MVVGGLAAAVVIGLVFGIFVRELWNWLMPDLFGLKTITYWQAFGIVILGQLIFGGSSSRGGGESKSSKSKSSRLEECGPGGEDGGSEEGIKHWKYYDEWWNSEGKKAFTGYVEKKGQEPDANPER